MSTTKIECCRKYDAMEYFLQQVNKHIRLPYTEIEINNKILDEVIRKNLVVALEQSDPLFGKLFKEIDYGGSYYEGLKVGKPEEYNLNFVLLLPQQYNAKVVQSNIPGYAHLVLESFKSWQHHNPDNYGIGQKLSYGQWDMKQQGPKAGCSGRSRRVGIYRTLEKCMSGNYVLCSKVKSWMEGALKKVLNQISQSSAGCAVLVSLGNRKVWLNVKYVKNGPALTLMIRGQHQGNPIIIDVDLVISFCFNNDNWPRNCKPNPYPAEQPHFYLIPKQPSSHGNDKYWRLSFPGQEKQKITGYQRIKPTIRLLKELRNQLNHADIASYYIKTIFLWEIDKNTFEEWNRCSLSYCFMKGLTLYEKYLRRQNIPFYWDNKLNLIGHINEKTLLCIANSIKNIIDDINRNITDSSVALEYLCPDLLEEESESESDVEYL